MIEATGLSVTRGGRRLMDVPALSIAGGEMLGILGPNGAGKSTLLRVLAGEMPPDSGRVALGGRALPDWPPAQLARHRAVLPQASSLGFPLRAREVVALGRTPHAGRGGDAVAAAMAAMGVAHLAARWQASLSGGEQQRVQAARVLAQLHGTPPAQTALFLDEPVAGLDLPHQHGLLAAARAHAMAGAAVVVVLHDVALSARYCTRLLLLAQGRVMAEGAPAAVLTEASVGALYGQAVRRVADPVGGEVLFVAA